MTNETYEFTFSPSVSLAEVQDTLRLAEMSAGAIHGQADLLIDGQHQLDIDKRTCRVDAGTVVGRDLVRLLVSFFSREFGPGAFRVERVGADRWQRETARSA